MHDTHLGGARGGSERVPREGAEDGAEDGADREQDRGTTPRRCRARSHRAGGCREPARLHLLQREPRVANIAQAEFRILGQAPLEQLAEPRGRRLGQGGPIHLALERLRDRVTHRLPFERALPREAFVEDAAEGPDVRAAIDDFASRLLGREIRGRAQDHAGDRR